LKLRAARWQIILGSWTLFGLYMAGQDLFVATRQGRTLVWQTVLVQEMVYAFLWAALTPLVIHLAQRFPLERPRRVQRAFVHLGFSVVVSILHRGAFSVLTGLYGDWVEGVPYSWERIGRNLFAFVDYGIILYWLLLLMWFGFDYYRRLKDHELKASHLQTQLVQAQLHALKMQLQPHFLFNTLNAISVLIKKDPDIARKTVGRLSDLLRMSLETGSAHEVPLLTELAFLEQYLEIEKTRFGLRLGVDVELDDSARGAYVPNLILQPMVENAIKHGVARRRGRTQVSIRAQIRDQQLLLSVRNDAASITGTKGDRLKEGVGLTNTRARLQRLYGDRSTLILTDDGNGTFVAQVVIPHHTEPLGEQTPDT
jgi:hypothetical protein